MLPLPEPAAPAAAEKPFDRRLSEILVQAARLFSDKGYEGASIRDLSRITGISLAGLYHYFDSKEKLLYRLQKHTFETVLANAERRISQAGLTPEKKLREFISNHLEFFLAERDAMKVLSHEDDALQRADRQRQERQQRLHAEWKGPNGGADNPLQKDISQLKHAYYRLCLRIVEELATEAPLRVKPRVGVMSLFGMLNWTYTWHSNSRDPGARELAAQMADLFMCGVRDGKRKRLAAARSRAGNGLLRPDRPWKQRKRASVKAKEN
jgi:AcrR family transcriptional regulator